MRRLLEKAKTDPEGFANARRKLNEVCLQWLSYKGVAGSPVTATKGALSGVATPVEFNLQIDNGCAGTVDNVEFNAAVGFTCPANCKPNGGSLGEAGVAETMEPGAPSTIDVGQLSQAHAVTHAYCISVDSSGAETGITTPSTISGNVQALGTYNGEVVQSPVAPISFA